MDVLDARARMLEQVRGLGVDLEGILVVEERSGSKSSRPM
jgi:hypothetical protein